MKKINNKVKSISLAIVIVLVLSVFEKLITGDGVDWFLSLEKPSILVPMNAFYIIAGLLALICIIVLSRLFKKYFDKPSNATRNGIIWIVSLLFFNGLWNYFFMGLESTRNGFIGMLLFTPIVIGSLFNLWKEDKVSFVLVSIYGIWVIYDIIWTYLLWQNGQL